MTIHCKSGETPKSKPNAVMTGMRSEYAHADFTATLSHSLNAVYDTPRNIVMHATGKNRRAGH